MLPQHSFIEVSISGKRENTHLIKQAHDFLLGQRVAPEEIALSEDKKVFKYLLYLRSVKREQALREEFLAQKQVGLRFKSKLLGADDWLHKWKEGFSIRRIGSRFLLVPSWQKGQAKGNPKTQRKPRDLYSKCLKIVLDPGCAFGSGSHETTTLALKLMEAVPGTFQSVLDLGTGSGILSVAAFRLGAKKILAIDCDPESVKVARQNLIQNGCRFAKAQKKNLKALRSKERYHLVVANLHSSLLIQEKQRIFSQVKPGGFLITSGVLKKDFLGFEKKFRSSKCFLTKKLFGRTWVSALYQKMILREKS